MKPLTVSADSNENAIKPSVIKVLQCLDVESWNEWRQANPSPTDEELDIAVEKYFRERPDMTPEDFHAGRDPLLEEAD